MTKSARPAPALWRGPSVSTAAIGGGCVRGWPSSRSGSRNVKMVDGSQLNRKIPFLQHLGSIVWARCSVFWVTAEWKCYLPPRKVPSLWFSCCIDTPGPTNYRKCHNHWWGHHHHPHHKGRNCCQWFYSIPPCLIISYCARKKWRKTFKDRNYFCWKN